MEVNIHEIVCCIYRRALEFGESSDESSSSSDDSSSSSDEKDTSGGEGKPSPEGSEGGSTKNHNHGNQGRTKRRRPPSPNAYEKMPLDSGKKGHSR